MMSCAPFDNKAERAFQALSYNQLKAAGLSIEAKSKEKHQSVEVWQGPAESIRIRFATSNVLTRWNVYVEAFSRRKGKWCHETYWYDERTKTIQEYTFYPMNLDDAAFSKKYGNDQHQI
jgi:hypothetical protein